MSSELSEPATDGSFSGSGIGCPLESRPLYTFVVAYCFESSALPVARSRMNKYPLRLNYAASLRRCPAMSPSNSITTCVASQSWVSCGEHWKYQDIFPVSAFSATIDEV